MRYCHRNYFIVGDMPNSMGEFEGPTVDEIDVPSINTRDNTLAGVSNAYVCWMDLMGAQNQMSTSLEESAIDMFNVHVAINESEDEYDVDVYPIMDGAYIVSDDQQPLRDFLSDTIAKLAKDNVHTDSEVRYTYIIRAAVSFGPVVHGNEVPERANTDFFHEDNPYPNSLIIGAPITQAFRGETNAPPFGIFVDESARAFAPEGSRPMDRRWYEWFRHHDPYHELARELGERLSDYYDWCEENTHRIGYSKSKIKRHRKMANEYLPSN